jgi:hypothetical protein
MFRAIEAEDFLAIFSSDRSHMCIGVEKVGKKYEKRYSAKPPDYPCITNSRSNITFIFVEDGDTMNLEKFLDMKNTDPKYGVIYNQQDFFTKFA